MSNGLPDTLSSSLSEFLAAEMGLYFPRDRWRDLERGILSAAGEFGLKDPEACAAWLMSSRLTRTQVEILASHLTVGETYFFREKKTFEALERHILPELIRSRRDTDRHLRFWSAGCATGEEPYSLAILLNRMLADLTDWNITILASDINPRFLRRASEGVYNQWSFRDCPTWIKDSCFERSKGGCFELRPQIRKMATMSYLNLAEDAYPSLLNNTNAMDVILCRNVLMYFAPSAAQKVAEKLFCALTNGGWLIVSPCETSQVLFSRFGAIDFSGAILYRKVEQQVQAPEVSPYLVAEELPARSQPPFEPPIQPELSEPRAAASIEIPPTEVAEQPATESAPAADRRALMLYERGRYAEAEEQLLAWLSEKPDDSKALALLARVHANQGRLREALECCDKAIAAEKVNAGSHYLRATILLEQGRWEEADTSLKRALYADPDFILAHFLLGNLARQQGKVRNARKHFANALSLLSAYDREQVVPESEGIAAGRLVEIIAAQRDQVGGVAGAALREQFANAEAPFSAGPRLTPV
jgi:chemotaxis protein methyltransferase CheR